jgi:hypothetical protein
LDNLSIKYKAKEMRIFTNTKFTVAVLLSMALLITAAILAFFYSG